MMLYILQSAVRCGILNDIKEMIKEIKSKDNISNMKYKKNLQFVPYECVIGEEYALRDIGKLSDHTGIDEKKLKQLINAPNLIRMHIWEENIDNILGGISTETRCMICQYFRSRGYDIMFDCPKYSRYHLVEDCVKEIPEWILPDISEKDKRKFKNPIWWILNSSQRFS